MANTHSLDLESGSSQYASIADASQTGLDLSTAFTFEMWIKPESWQAASITYFLSKAVTFNNDAAFQFYYDLQGGGNELYLTVTDGSNNDGLHVTKSLATGVWHHIAVTWQGSNKNCKFYVNGAQVGSTQVGSNVASLANSGNPFIVGQKNSSGYFDGLINDMRVWNTVRTAQEILDNFQTQLVGNESGLVAYWKFNNSYNDETSNNNDLTASGSPTFSTTVPFHIVTDISTTTALSTGLKAHYSMEEASGTRVDDVGSYDLTDVNTVAQATGRVGFGADFENANSEYLYNSSTGEDLNPTGSNPFTVAGWFKAESLPGGSSAIIIAVKTTDNSVGQPYKIYIKSSGGGNFLEFQTWASSGSFLSLTTTVVPTTGAWYHFAFVKANASDWKGYLNGVLVVSSTSTRSIASTNLQGVAIGAEDQGSSGINGYFDGVIDQIFISAAALTDVDIRDLYNNGAGLPYSGSTAYDQTLDETVNLVETQTRLTGKSLAEALVLVDTLAKSIGKTLDETAVLVDSFSSNYLFVKTLDDILALDDTGTQKITAKTLFEALVLVDDVYRSLARSLAEALVLVDTQSLVHSFTKQLDETLTLVDTLTKQTTKSLAEIIALVDEIQNTKMYNRSFFEELVLVDTVAKMANKVITDSLTLVDTMSKVGTFGRSLGEVVTLVEYFQGLINGQNIAWYRKYTEQAGTWIKKYLDIP